MWKKYLKFLVCCVTLLLHNYLGNSKINLQLVGKKKRGHSATVRAQ